MNCVPIHEHIGVLQPSVFTEFVVFSDKIFVITVKGLEPLPTSHLLCEMPACYHSVRKTYVRERNFKLNPIHASMNSVKVALHLGKTPLVPFHITMVA